MLLYATVIHFPKRIYSNTILRCSNVLQRSRLHFRDRQLNVFLDFLYFIPRAVAVLEHLNTLHRRFEIQLELLTTAKYVTLRGRL